MVFFDAVERIGAGTAGETVNVGRNMLAPLINQGISEGLSGRSMLGALQSAGLGIRRGSFYDLVANVRDSIAASPAIAASPMDALPDLSNIVDWRGGKADTYLYRLNVFTRERDENGEFQITNRAWDVQSESLITPEEASAKVSDNWETSDEYPSELMGITVRGVYHQTGH
jgi:hypothetical protein